MLGLWMTIISGNRLGVGGYASLGMLKVNSNDDERRRSRTSLASIIDDLTHLRKSLLRQKSEGEVSSVRLIHYLVITHYCVTCHS